MDEMVKATQEWLNKTYKGEKDFTPFAEKDIDGITGAGTFKRLIQALQIEINKQYGKNIKVDGDFGDGTLKALPATIGKSNTKNNIVHIIQSSLWCKGYSAGAMDGIYGNSTASAVTTFQVDAGITGDGVIKPYVLQGIMNTDGYVYKGVYESDKYYKHLVQKAMNKYYGATIGLTAPNGLWDRKSHKNLIKCCQVEWNLVPDGKFGKNTMNAAPTLSKKKSGYVNSKRLLNWALTVNGFYPGEIEGVFNEKTASIVQDFQKFCCLDADGYAGKNTWASLLSSAGNNTRKGAACDCITELTNERAKLLVKNGYTIVGRYLTNASNSSLNKKIQENEIKTICENGLSIFPIFQTFGSNSNYFSKVQGISDASSAFHAAKHYGFKKGSIIYFSVDYDATEYDITNRIIPHFEGLNNRIKDFNNYYKIGIYGTRNVCTQISNKGLAVSSFVSDMSTGYGGNMGFPLPSNWAFDQISTITVSDNKSSIEVDNNIKSGRDNGSNKFDKGEPYPDYLDDYYTMTEFVEKMKKEISTKQDSFVKESMLSAAKRVRTTDEAFDNLMKYDRLITELSVKYRIRKAILQAIIMREQSFEGVDDSVADMAVESYLSYLIQLEKWEKLPLEQRALIPQPTYLGVVKEDSSTGFCQIFAKTAINSINYAKSLGVYSFGPYDYGNLEERLDIWKKLHSNDEYNISICPLVLIYGAHELGLNNSLYGYDDENIKAVLSRYNGTNDKAKKYGDEVFEIYLLFEKYNSLTRG